mgnify:CR=1 FL=1
MKIDKNENRKKWKSKKMKIEKKKWKSKKTEK